MGDSMEYCDFRVDIENCVGDSFYTAVFQANLYFFWPWTWVLCTILALIRHKIRKVPLIGEAGIGPVEAIALGSFVHSFLHGLYAVLLLTNGFGPYYLPREALFLIPFAPIYHAILRVGRSLMRGIPATLFGNGLTGRFLSSNAPEWTFGSLIVFAYLWCLIPGIVIGVFHDQGNMAVAQMALKISLGLTGLLNFLVGIFFIVIGYPFLTHLSEGIENAVIIGSGLSISQPGQTESQFYMKEVLFRMKWTLIVVVPGLFAYGVVNALMGLYPLFFTILPLAEACSIILFNGSNTLAGMIMVALIISEIKHLSFAATRDIKMNA